MNDDDSGTIGARLRELRRWRRMTLTEVAGLAGISAAYLSMAERGLRSLDRRSTISALAAALRVSPVIEAEASALTQSETATASISWLGYGASNDSTAAGSVVCGSSQ